MRCKALWCTAQAAGFHHPYRWLWAGEPVPFCRLCADGMKLELEPLP